MRIMKLQLVIYTLISISISMIAAMMVRTAELSLCGLSSHDWKGMLMWASCNRAIVPKYAVLNENIRDSEKKVTFWLAVIFLYVLHYFY